jgi:predicted Zn finger-like uncharacterized protein
MLKVECEACKAPYQIDERRVPPAGLKMRCAKCGHSFLVTSSGVAAPAPQPPPAAKKPTMAGVGEGAPRQPAQPPKPPSATAPTAPAIPAAAMPAAAKRTMVGVGTPGSAAGAAGPPGPPRPAPPVNAPPPTPQASATPARPSVPSDFPSDFPAALGSLEETDLPVVSAGLPVAAAPKPPPPLPPRAIAAKKDDAAFGTIDLDLPALAADLPTAKPGAKPAVKPVAKPTARAGSFDLDLPSPASNLPTRKLAPGITDLPVVAADLPVPAASLPVPAASLPVPAASLPVPAASLPVPAASLPVPAASLPMAAASLPVAAAGLPTARGFGEIDLPSLTESLPAVPGSDRHLPATMDSERHMPVRAGSGSMASTPAGGFGEIELPAEAPHAPAAPSFGVPDASATDFDDLVLEDHPRSNRPSGPAVRGGGSGGMAYGEVEFGGDGGAPAGEAAIGVDEPARPPTAEAPPLPPRGEAAITAPVSVRGPAVRERPPVVRAKRPMGRRIALLVAFLALAGGAVLEFVSPYGAFGRFVIQDRLHAGDYKAATLAAIGDFDKVSGPDTYDVARAAGDAAAAAHQRTPRALALSAYAAFADYAITVRFGQDTSRAPRGKQLLAELPPNEKIDYRDIALAAQFAEGGEIDRARKGLDAASRQYAAADPVQGDVALLRGAIELAAKDGNAALAAFKRAAGIADDARAHYGLARAYDMLGDAANAKKEIAATLAGSPTHPGALVLRARMKSAATDETQALADLAKVIDGPARAKASPAELSDAYAARAWVSLERGGASEARDAFAQAVKLNARNVEALNGEGRLMLNEGRYTEALSRFDTSLQVDPNAPETIANDAEAKLALERLADAKAQLVDAARRFPKSLAVLLVLGRVEQHLGNKDAAEADLRAAITYADPSRPNAVLPYVALAELLAARGHLGDAKATLDDARKKLPASTALDRAFGEVAELQGDYDTAIADYRSALVKSPKDVSTHFKLGVALRRVHKFDEAGAELDQVAAVDKDYPGLSLERGLLFEQSGDVEKAIEQFKSALAKAPDDPDLQLRVGASYVAIGRADDALPILRKVLEKRPTSAEAFHYIGRALMLKGPGENTEAIRHLKRAADLDPNRPEFHVYLAWAANEATPAQLEIARDEVEKALAIDKMNAEAYWQKGILERMTGAVEDAIKDERRALELKPTRYEAHATLAECYEDKNDDGTASAEWAKAIAGDGPAAADGTVAHPYWRFKYGKLLLDRSGAGAALGQLVPAVTTAEKLEPRPAWVAPLEFQAAEALRKGGKKADAIEHYKRFLEIAPVNSPERADAQTALGQLGVPK